ncbi:MAG TPA: hypothetical protein VMZ52_07980 [Bryobacteraceae bacterium]|nr:hypothetical protein [Bryobacteraceae bacterium]
MLDSHQPTAMTQHWVGSRLAGLAFVACSLFAQTTGTSCQEREQDFERLISVPQPTMASVEAAFGEPIAIEKTSVGRLAVYNFPGCRIEVHLNAAWAPWLIKARPNATAAPTQKTKEETEIAEFTLPTPPQIDTSTHAPVRANLSTKKVKAQKGSIGGRKIAAESYFPALTYGPNAWSVISLHNPNAVAVDLSVSAYTATATELVNEMLSLPPNEKREFRVESPSEGFQWALAKVSQSVPKVKGVSLVNIEVKMHNLVGDNLFTLPRESSIPKHNIFATDYSAKLSDLLLFIGNADTGTASMTICFSYQPPMYSGSLLLDIISGPSFSCNERKDFTIGPYASEMYTLPNRSGGYYIFKGRGKKMIVLPLHVEEGQKNKYVVDSRLSFSEAKQ